MSDALDHIIEDVWTKFDLDKNGTINFAESLPFYKELIANRADLGLTEEHHQTWFDQIDGDHDGTISKDELKGYLAGINYEHHHH